MHNLCFFHYFLQKSIFTGNYFLIAAINWLPGVHCILVLFYLRRSNFIQDLWFRPNQAKMGILQNESLISKEHDLVNTWFLTYVCRVADLKLILLLVLKYKVTKHCHYYGEMLGDWKKLEIFQNIEIQRHQIFWENFDMFLFTIYKLWPSFMAKHWFLMKLVDI